MAYPTPRTAPRDAVFLAVQGKQDWFPIGFLTGGPDIEKPATVGMPFGPRVASCSSMVPAYV